MSTSEAGAAAQETRYREIFTRLHRDHDSCIDDEWLTESCAVAGQRIGRPVVWSRRNGPWRRVTLLVIGAAPGNAGGRGRGERGAHATRIPFGGDVAGANLDVLLGSVGTDRNQVFIAAALNSLPDAGGGEPTVRELTRPVGDYENSIHALRDTLIAAGPALVVCLGNVALRALAGAIAGTGRPTPLNALRRQGMERGRTAPVDGLGPDVDFLRAWNGAWNSDPGPTLLWLTHPSAQNMSPFASRDTKFHKRMREARSALRDAVREIGWRLPDQRVATPYEGIYALPEWRNLIAPYHERLALLWRSHGL